MKTKSVLISFVICRVRRVQWTTNSAQQLTVWAIRWSHNKKSFKIKLWKCCKFFILPQLSGCIQPNCCTTHRPSQRCFHWSENADENSYQASSWNLRREFFIVLGVSQKEFFSASIFSPWRCWKMKMLGEPIKFIMESLHFMALSPPSWARL